MTYPPIFKCCEVNDVKKFLYTSTIWKIWGGLTFQSLVDFSWVVTEFECLDSVVANAIVEIKITHQVFRVIMESTLIFFPKVIGL